MEPVKLRCACKNISGPVTADFLSSPGMFRLKTISHTCPIHGKLEHTIQVEDPDGRVLGKIINIGES